MAVEATCSCGKHLRGPDEFAGKNVKCPSCGSVVALPTLELADPLGALDDPFASDSMPDPLAGGNDPFATQAGPAASSTTCPSCGTPMAAHAVLCVSCGYHTQSGQKMAVKKGPPPRPKRESGFGFDLGEYKTPILATLGFVGLAALLGLIFPALGAILVLGGFLITGLVGAVGGIWLLLVAFDEDVVCGLLMFFVPFYGLYYLIDRWENEPPFLLTAGAMIGNLLLIGYLMLNVAVASVLY